MMIGEVARRTDTKVTTIRFYETIGLLPRPARTESGRRSYDDDGVRRLSFIRHARSLGFAVADIRTLLALDDRSDRPCDDADRIARTQLGAIEAKIARLTRLAGELQRIASACAGGGASGCRVIETLADRSLCEDAHSG